MPSERQESCAQGGAGKKSCPGSMTSQGQAELPEWHGKEAGWSWILFKTKFRKSVAEVSRNHGKPQARHLSTQSRKQTVWGDVKALPLCQDLLGPNHDLAVLVSQGKVFIPTTTATDFFPFKPRHPLSESQTTPAICCPPHKAGGTSPSTIRRERNALPSPAPAAGRNGHHTSAPKPTVKAQGCMPCPRLSLNPNVPEHQGMSVSLGGMCQAPLTWPRG